MLSAAPQASLTLLSCSPNYLCGSRLELDGRTLDDEICNSQRPTGQLCYFLPCHPYSGMVQCFLKDNNGL